MAAETPAPTLDDLLAACDLAEEGGAPPAVVAALRDAARIRAVVEGLASWRPTIFSEGLALSIDTNALSRRMVAAEILRAARSSPTTDMLK
jgi:hypothetical protein